MSIGKLTQESFSELVEEKKKQGYRLDRVDWKKGELHFKEAYPGAIEKARSEKGGR
ncbi:hypothetical protein [Nonomuraea basaltis]|uniref:hypothetical protein n=1 Tax=Nonomuraea basaltis TaxID=2495887 RepID=UPI0014869FB4|nr:hypothetical protein [Nonomuraea basaltis]